MAAGHSVDDLAAIYIAGGSSRIPLIWRRIEERLGKQPSTFGDPKAVIALGAARVHLPTISRPVSRNETARTGGGETPPTDPPRPPGRDDGPVTRRPQSLERTRTVSARAVALLGAVAVIVSEFLPRHNGQNLWGDTTRGLVIRSS